jgi:hypothetical protein
MKTKNLRLSSAAIAFVLSLCPRAGRRLCEDESNASFKTCRRKPSTHS